MADSGGVRLADHGDVRLPESGGVRLTDRRYEGWLCILPHGFLGFARGPGQLAGTKPASRGLASSPGVS